MRKRASHPGKKLSLLWPTFPEYLSNAVSYASAGDGNVGKAWRASSTGKIGYCNSWEMLGWSKAHWEGQGGPRWPGRRFPHKDQDIAGVGY